MAFLPTYFAAEDSRQKAGLLAMLLIINGTLTIMCLFVPKVWNIINVYYMFEILLICTHYNMYNNNNNNNHIAKYKHIYFQIYATIYVDDIQLNTNKISFKHISSSKVTSNTK